MKWFLVYRRDGICYGSIDEPKLTQDEFLQKAGFMPTDVIVDLFRSDKLTAGSFFSYVTGVNEYQSVRG